MQIQMHVSTHYLVVASAKGVQIVFKYDENVDEAPFNVNICNDHTLEFQRDNNVKYIKVVSSENFITMVARILEGGIN